MASSEILNVVIDERKRFENDNLSMLNLGRGFIAGQASQRCVFKNYILSSEVYTLDNAAN